MKIGLGSTSASRNPAGSGRPHVQLPEHGVRCAHKPVFETGPLLFAAFLPLAVVGVLAAWRLGRQP